MANENNNSPDAPVNAVSPSISITRDLSKARNAHKVNDIEASRQAHVARQIKDSKVADNGNEDISDDDTRAWKPHSAAQEDHQKYGKYVKSLVYGGVDGSITTFAVVAGVSGAGLSSGIIIMLGLANLFADGLSMGISDYLSSTAELDFAIAERRREEWETENFLEGEKQEMVEIYQNKGLTKEDAETVINVISRYKDVFVDAMLVDELGIQPPDLTSAPWKDGVVTFIAFCVFGFIPLIAYIVSYAVDQSGHHSSSNWPFLVSCILTGMTLFLLGAGKSFLTRQHWLKGGLMVLGTGGVAAAAAYVVGFLLEPLAR